MFMRGGRWFWAFEDAWFSISMEAYPIAVA